MHINSVFNPLLIYYFYIRLNFGKKRQHISLYEMRKKDFKTKHPPIIFLSTGRCGTKWLTNIINKDSSIHALHHPIPVMRSQAKIAYENSYTNATKKEAKLLKEMFLSGREEILLHIERARKRLTITDSRSTFFAEVIFDLYPNAKFVHLHRHPGEVIRSALSRNWYNTENDSELNRITPQINGRYYETWPQMDLIQKNAWLWSATNEWILQFLKRVPISQQFAISFNQWNSETLTELFKFCGIEISSKTIKNYLRKKVNAQHHRTSEQYQNWSTHDKNKVKTICGSLSEQLDYKL